MHGGCGCRGSAGWAHLPCLVEAATHSLDTWHSCPTCTQEFSGEMQLGLALARCEQAQGLPRVDEDRLMAADRLGVALSDARDYTGALPLLEEVLEVSRIVDGDDDVNTCASMCNLASLLSDMDRGSEARPLLEEALAAQRRTLGPEQVHTRSPLQLDFRLWSWGIARVFAATPTGSAWRTISRCSTWTWATCRHRGR